MNRGDRREPIFHDEGDRQRFLETLGEACGKTGWQVHAYCLLPNRFHLVVETPQPNLVAGMQWFPGTYTGRFNRRHKWFGHLFSGRYQTPIVDRATPGHLNLVKKPKTDRRKARIARRLRRETTMTLAWIAQRLQVGSVNTLKNTLRLADSRDPCCVRLVQSGAIPANCLAYDLLSARLRVRTRFMNMPVLMDAATGLRVRQH